MNSSLNLLTVEVDSPKNKIPWNEHALLHMISEYFPACNKPLNFVKKPSFIGEFEYPRQTQAALLDLGVDKTLGMSLF